MLSVPGVFLPKISLVTFLGLNCVHEVDVFVAWNYLDLLQGCSIPICLSPIRRRENLFLGVPACPLHPLVSPFPIVLGSRTYMLVVLRLQQMRGNILLAVRNATALKNARGYLLLCSD